jgi:hypothetical protein
MNQLQEPTEPSLREEYARYFFSLFDACLHEDAVGQRQAQAHLEEALTRVGPLAAPEPA